MMIKTTELSHFALDWMVAKYEGLNIVMLHTHMKEKARINNYTGDLDWQLEMNSDLWVWIKKDGATRQIPHFSTEWSLGGPIIARERYSFVTFGTGLSDKDGNQPIVCIGSANLASEGDTHLIAAMRCLIRSNCGDEVEIPDNLI